MKEFPTPIEEEHVKEDISTDEHYESIETEFKGLAMEGLRNKKTKVVERAVGHLPDKSRVELLYDIDTGAEKELRVYDEEGRLIEFLDISAVVQAERDTIEYLKTLLVIENETIKSELRGESQHGH